MTTMDKINKLLKQKGLYGYQLTSALGLSRGVFSQWNSGITKPSQKNLRRIADYFNVPYETLLPDDEEKEKAPLHEEEGLNEAQKEAIRLFDSLTPDGRQMLLALARTLKAQEDIKNDKQNG